jgi:NAD dependent epimerase/dehydratase family enzyme
MQGDRRPVAVLAGASGFIGRHLGEALEADGYRVVRIGRTGPDARWGETQRIRSLVDGAAVLVNLAGKSVNCRYTEANRREVLRSRIETTRELGEAVAAAASPPALWLNSSTGTIYRNADDRPMTEADGELGSGFSVDVARHWEAAFAEADAPRTRKVALRMAIVLGDDGQATRLLARLARLGLGGPQFHGPWPGGGRRLDGITASGDRVHGTANRKRTGGARQRFSWVHVDDVIGAVRHCIADGAIAGAVNVAAPATSDNRALMATLRRIVGAPFGLPAFRWMLEPAMWALRTEPELILKSRWVHPRRLIESGYVFQRPTLEDALRASLER